MKEKIIEKLLSYPYKEIEFTKNPEADELLNNLKKYPHAFVLACIMNRQMKAEKVWLIPYKISKEIGGFEFQKLFKKLKQIKRIFKKRNLTRYNNKMAEDFCSAVVKIKEKYNGDASKIWKNNPTSCIIVNRFLEFEGVGRKIATMAVNILVRDFKIKTRDRHCIDISPDRQVKRVFERTGFMRKDANNDELMYCTRELNQKYPGVFDLPAWEIGRKWCHPQDPDCENCYLNKYCPRMIK